MGVAGGGLHTLVGCLAASMVVGVRLSGVEDSCLDNRDVLLSTVPSQNQDSRFGDPKREEGGDLRKRIGDSRQLDAGRRERKRTSSGAEATENDFEERIEEDEPGLRAAPFLFVGGDVGSESPQKEGVATDGVALQN